MGWLKFSADNIFTGTQMLDANHVLVAQPDGRIEAIISYDNAGDDVQHLNGIVSPGFINCHCHTELSHMKGRVPEKTGLIDFVFKVVTQRHFTQEEISAAIAAAEEEMLLNGIVAVGDICNTTHSLPQKANSKLTWYNFLEVTGWLPAVAQTRFEKSREMYEAFCRQGSDLNAVVPHAPYSVSEELWNLITAFFPGKTISIHNQETAFEDRFFQQGDGDFLRMYEMMQLHNSSFTPSGKSSLRTYYPRLSGAQNVLLVHNTFTPAEDILYAKQQAMHNGQQLFFCICINANLYIENTPPPVDILLHHNCSLVLGTDSLASNHQLSILNEMQCIQKHFPQVAVSTLLQSATINGAKALQMADTLGSFTPGKTPGILLVNNDLSSVKRLV